MPRAARAPPHNRSVAAASSPPVVYVLDNFDDEEIIILDDSDDEKDVIVLDDFDEDDEDIDIVEVIQPAKAVAAEGSGVIQPVGVMQPPVALGLLQPAGVDELKSPVTQVNPMFLEKDMATRQEGNGEGKKFVIRFPRSSGGSSPSLQQADDPSGENPPCGGGGRFVLNFPRSRASSASNIEREGCEGEIIDSAVVGNGQEKIVKLSGFASNPAEHGAFDMKEGLPHITSSIVSSSLGVVPRVPATRPGTTTTRIMYEKDVVGVADRYKVIQGHQLHYDGSGKQHRGDDLPHLRQGLAHIVEDDKKTTQKKRYKRSNYDVSHLIPVKTLLPHEWETTSLQSFSVNECAALKKTGCAKVSINGVPSLTKLQSSVPDQISLLFQLTHGKLTAYMYRFTEPPVITTPSSSSLVSDSGSLSSSSTVASPVKAWGVKYSSIRKYIQPGNFLKLAQKEEESGHFKGLPQSLPFNDDLYWSRVSSGALALSQERPVITYPADNPASILEAIHDFPKAWNIGTLDKESDLLRAIMPDLDFYEDTIEGYTTSALYIGASGTTFALHAEDMNLASVNYLIAGAPKVWYCVPPSEYTKIVDLISKIFAGSSLVKSCPQAVMHKQFLVHPDTLRDHGIVCSRIVQQPGDLIITHPGAFHFGYNTGFNIAEATNFATSEWYTGGHLQDTWNVGRCSCLSGSRFYFKKEMVLNGLRRVGRRFGLDLSKLPPSSQGRHGNKEKEDDEEEERLKRRMKRTSTTTTIATTVTTTTTTTTTTTKVKNNQLLPHPQHRTGEFSSSQQATNPSSVETFTRPKNLDSAKVTASSRWEGNHSSLDSSSMMTKNPDSAAVIANHNRLAGKREREKDVSAPPSPTHSQSTVEVDLCDEDLS